MRIYLLNPLRWKRSFLLTLLVGFLVVWFGFLDTYSVWTRYQLHREKQELKQETQQLKEQTEELEQKIEEFQEDPGVLERVAREQYGMRKPDETVYRIRE